MDIRAERHRFAVSVILVLAVSLIVSCGNDEPFVPVEEDSPAVGEWYLECTSSSLMDVWGTGDGEAYAAATSAYGTGTLFKLENDSWSAVLGGPPEICSGIWGAAPDDIFAVGKGRTYHAGGVYHFDGDTWEEIYTHGTLLASVCGRSGTDVYAVAHIDEVLHYDGIEWNTILTREGTVFSDVWTASGSDVYVTGLYYEPDHGPTGLILRYDGEDWHVERTDSTMTFDGIWGSSDEDVYTAGSYNFTDNPYVTGLWGSIHHNDGNGWEVMPDVPYYAFPFTGIHGAAPDRICVSGKDGTLIEYDGDLWRVVTTGTANHLNSVWCGIDGDVIAVGDGGTVVRFDDGIARDGMEGSLCGLSDVWGTSITDLYGINRDGILHFDGTEWREMTTPHGVDSYAAIWGFSSSDIFASSDYGTVYHYNGTGWGEMDYRHDTALRDFWGASPMDVYAVAATGVVHFDGTEWVEVVTGGYELEAIWGSSEDFIFAVGGAGGTDGLVMLYDGVGWEESFTSESFHLNDVWGFSESDVYAVGGGSGGGIVLHFDGDGWQESHSGFSADLYGVWGSSGTDVYAVGENGMILHYDGAEWSVYRENDDYLLCIWGEPDSEIIVGGGSSILRYSTQ